MDNENRQLKLKGKFIYSLKELKENFNADELATAYKNGSLIRWLEFFFYENLAEKVKNIKTDKDLSEQLTNIFMANSEDYVSSQKIFSSDNKKFDKNRDNRKDIFKGEEALLKEADDCYAKEDYRGAAKKYMEAYYLGNEKVDDKLIKSLNVMFSDENLPPTEEKFFKSRKFLYLILAVLTTTSVIFSCAYFNSLNEIRNLNAVIQDERAKYVNDISVLKQQLDKTKKDLEKVRKETDRHINPVSILQQKGSNISSNHGTVSASNSDIRGNDNDIYGNDNDIYGDNNRIYGNNNKIHGNNNKTIRGENNVTISEKR